MFYDTTPHSPDKCYTAKIALPAATPSAMLPTPQMPLRTSPQACRRLQ